MPTCAPFTWEKEIAKISESKSCLTKFDALVVAETTLVEKYKSKYSKIIGLKHFTLTFPCLDVIDKCFVVINGEVCMLAHVDYNFGTSTLVTPSMFLYQVDAYDKDGTRIGDLPIHHMGEPVSFVPKGNVTFAEFFRHFAGKTIEVIDRTVVYTWSTRTPGTLLERYINNYKFVDPPIAVLWSY